MSPLQVLQNHYQADSLTASQQNSSHVPQILLLLLLGVLASLGAPPPSRGISGTKTQCVVADVEYNANETWYRHLRTSSASHCVRCICKSDGFSSSVTCSNVTCGQTACEGSKREECCDVCYGSAEAKTINTMHLNPEGGSNRMPCLHNGRIFQDGDEFSSNATGLQAQKPNQCIHCMCQAGLVLCRLKTCLRAHCVTTDTKNCCPTCKDEETREEDSQTNPVLVTIMVSDGQSTTEERMRTICMIKKKSDCTAAGVTYSHGSSWHPVIGPFGPMDCVSCKCQFGKIECSRLNCPPLQKLPCAKPIQVPGHCCPQCIGESQSTSIVTKESMHPVLHQPSISVTMEQKTQGNSNLTPGAMFNCLPPQTNTLVFRSHAASSSSAYYQYAFQAASGDLSTRLLTWTIKDGHIGDFSEQHLSKEEFKILMGTFKFKLQGATRTKFMEKFIRKAKKLPDHCGNRCATKIQRLEQVLHLREIIKRQRCLDQETSFQ